MLERRIRAFSPWPGASLTANGEPIKVLSARLTGGQGPAGRILAVNADGLEIACGEGSLLLNLLQLAGKKPQNLAAILNGHPQLFQPGQQLSIPNHA